MDECAPPLWTPDPKRIDAFVAAVLDASAAQPKSAMTFTFVEEGRRQLFGNWQRELLVATGVVPARTAAIGEDREWMSRRLLLDALVERLPSVLFDSWQSPDSGRYRYMVGEREAIANAWAGAGVLDGRDIATTFRETVQNLIAFRLALGHPPKDAAVAADDARPFVMTGLPVEWRCYDDGACAQWSVTYVGNAATASLECARRLTALGLERRI